MKIDWWYKPEKIKECSMSILFYPNAGEYRGNFYKNGKPVGDFVCKDSVELEKYVRKAKGGKNE